MQILSRELEAVDRFSRAAFHFVGILEDERLKVFAAEFVDGLTAIGESELHARQMDRCEVLGVQGGRKEVARERFKELNERGRKIVLSSASRLKALRDDFERDPSQETATLTNVQLKEWRERLYGMLVDLEMKGSDVQQVQESIDEYANAMRTKGPGAVLTLTERKVKELHKVRGQSGRGATTNIAIWKAIAIAVFIGVGLWAIFKCSFFGCSITENLAYGTIMLIAFLVAIFC